MFSDIQFCHSVFLQESEKYLKKSIDILSISASQLLSYLYIYICFVFSLECKNGGLDRWFSATLGGPGGRNRAWRPSPSSARFSLLVSFPDFCCSHLFLPFVSFLLTSLMQFFLYLCLMPISSPPQDCTFSSNWFTLSFYLHTFTYFSTLILFFFFFLPFLLFFYPLQCIV